MYQPEKYKNDSRDFIFKFIRNHPFATSIVQGGHLLATHIPVLVKGSPENFRLFGHIANHNPMRGYLKDNVEMLLIFKGPDAYISSSWYASPEIPTWDYVAVHINAMVNLQTPEELEIALRELITHFEKDSDLPIAPTEIPETIWKENFEDITGFWLDPFILKGIEKLHQGFGKKDIGNIAKELGNRPICPNSLIDLMNKKHGI